MESSQSNSERGQRIQLKGEFSPEDFSKDGHSRFRQQTFPQERGGSGCSSYRLVTLCLGLLNVLLLIAAVVIGICCNQVNESYNQIPHEIATPLILELNHLHSNHSSLIKANENARKALESELSSHMELKQQVERQTTVNDGLQLHIEELKAEKTNLLSNKSALEESCGQCQPRWTFLKSSCYFFSNKNTDSQKNWPESRADCISRGGDLLVIDDWDEQQLITENYRDVRSSDVWWANGYWIGLTDIEQEGTWVWINGVIQQEPLHWIDGEPNNHGAQGENCAAFFARGNPTATWYDGKCHHHQYNWICEMKPQESNIQR